LERELQKLSRIEKENYEKEKEIEEAIERLKEEYSSA
jgi:hypothetical protein